MKIQKSFILIISFLFINLICASAQAKNELIGFYNIPFGASKAEIKQVMQAKGWRFISIKDKELGEYYEFRGSKYATKQFYTDETIVFYFYQDKFFRADVNIQLENNDTPTKDWINDYEEVNVEKYNLKISSEMPANYGWDKPYIDSITGNYFCISTGINYLGNKTFTFSFIQTESGLASDAANANMKRAKIQNTLEKGDI